MQASDRLIEFLDRTPLPWMFFDKQKEKLIFVVDNHLLGTFRACPQHFVRANVEGYHQKSHLKEGEQSRIWFLDFGIALHAMLETYYRDFRESSFDANKWAVEKASALWMKMNMDVHSEDKEYKLIGGMFGFVGLLAQYAVVMSPQNEKLRVLATEVSFGRAGEVPLFIGNDCEIYLAGRMDMIVDDGYFICPMDHKSQGSFRGDPGLMYETDEGPTGYIYALSRILPTTVPEDQILKRDCTKILMNLIQKAPATVPADRFKRIQIRKTTWQLDSYRERQVDTVERLLAEMERVARGLPVYRNDKVCTNWFHRNCTYRDVCRQQSFDGEQATLMNGFVKLPIWNTEEIPPTT